MRHHHRPSLAPQSHHNRNHIQHYASNPSLPHYPVLGNEVSRIVIEIYICQFHHQRYINPESLSHYGSKAAAPP